MTQLPVDRLQRQLNDYLQKQTNYAIMLTASWGAGKTHYLKQKFFPQLSDTDYQGIIVSLFGVTSIDDIKDRIFLALFPILENKYLKASGSILKLILKSVDVSKIWGKGFINGSLKDIEEAKQNFDEQKFDFVKLEKLLICFDDLERANPSMLEENQILGYINSLVEDDNIKVIIIANEGKINLGEIKEKTIGNTIHFHQDYEQAFEDIIQNLQHPTTSFVSHLRENKTLIHDFLIRENNENINYRTFTYFLSHYSKICHYIQSGFKVSALNDRKSEILTRVLKFSLFICIEFKKGNISFREKNDLDNTVDFMISRLYEEKSQEKPKAYNEEVIDLYFPNQDYKYYKSIYDYLTGGDYFDEVKLYEELCEEHHVLNQDISLGYKILDQLSVQKYKKLSDQDYIKLTRALKEQALNGQFTAPDYMLVFFYIMRHGNVLNINPEALVLKFIKVIKSLQKNHQYITSLRQYFNPHPDGEFYEYSQQLFKVIEEVNENALIAEQYKYDQEVEKKFLNDFNSLYDDICQNLRKPFSRTTLSGIRPSKFYQKFAKTDNAEKSKIITLFRIAYDAQSGNNSKQDFDFLTSLEQTFKDKMLKIKPKNVSASLFQDLLNEVSKKAEVRAPYHSN